MAYQSTKLQQPICITDIITIHYFEYMKHFHFPGEAHDFWEMLCVDKGEVEVQTDNHTYTLKGGEIIFHKPMEFHSIKALGETAPNLIAISFKSPSIQMSFFHHKRFTLNTVEKILISKVISEAQSAFSTPLHIPAIEQVERSDTALFGAEQLIKIHLEELLILLIRKESRPVSPKYPMYSKTSKTKTFEAITHYLEAHICEVLTVETICNDNLISRSCLQALFHEKTNRGVIDYFHQLKINLAKQLIREANLNFTQIADFLSYSSIGHFSKQFKKFTNMSPSEYASSIKLLSEHTTKSF